MHCHALRVGCSHLAIGLLLEEDTNAAHVRAIGQGPRHHRVIASHARIQVLPSFPTHFPESRRIHPRTELGGQRGIRKVENSARNSCLSSLSKKQKVWNGGI